LWRHYAGVLDATFSPDGRRVLTGGRDYHLYLWNGHTGTFLRSLPDPPTTAVHSIRFSPDGKLVVTAEHNGIATVRRTSTWIPIARIITYPNPNLPSPLAEAVFSPDGRRVATVSINGWAGIFDSHNGELLGWLSATRQPVGPAHPLGAGTGVAWSSDGRFVVTTATDSVLHVWNPSNGKLLATLRGHVGRASSPSFAPNSDLVVTAGAERTAAGGNRATDRPVALLRGGAAAISAAAFSPDGRWVVTGDAAGVTDVWDWRRQKLLGALPTH